MVDEHIAKKTTFDGDPVDPADAKVNNAAWHNANAKEITGYKPGYQAGKLYDPVKREDAAKNISDEYQNKMGTQAAVIRPVNSTDGSLSGMPEGQKQNINSEYKNQQDQQKKEMEKRQKRAEKQKKKEEQRAQPKGQQDTDGQGAPEGQNTAPAPGKGTPQTQDATTQDAPQDVQNTPQDAVDAGGPDDEGPDMAPAGVGSKNPYDPESNMTDPDEEIELDRKQKAQAFLDDLGAVTGLAGNVVDSMDKQMGNLKNVVGSILTGNPLKMGAQVGQSIVDAGKALKPLKDGVARSLGLNEKNGTIDQDAAGTLKGAQYYQTKARIDKFYENNDKWLEECLGEGANSKNMAEYLDNLPDDLFNDFAEAYNKRARAEVARIRNKPGKPDKYDMALVDAYTDLGNNVKRIASDKARDAYLDAARYGTQATMERIKERLSAGQFNTMIDEMSRDLNKDPYADPVQRVLFNTMEKKIRSSYGTGDGTFGSGNHYLESDGKGGLQVKMDRLKSRDWSNLRDRLESIAVYRDLEEPEMKLLEKANTVLGDRVFNRQKFKADLDLERSKLAQAMSPIDWMLSDREYRWKFKNPEYFDEYLIPKKEGDRTKLMDHAEGFIRTAKDKIAKRLAKDPKEPDMDLNGEGWNRYLTEITSPGRTRKLTPAEMSALKSQNFEHMIQMGRDMDTIMAGDFLDSQEPEARMLKDKLVAAADAVKKDRTLKRKDKVKQYRSGVQEGSPEERYIKARNEVANYRRMQFVMREAGDPSDEGYDKRYQRAIDDAVAKYPFMDPGDDAAVRIFGPNLGGQSGTGAVPAPTYENIGEHDLLNDEETVLPTTKSAFRLDAQGLTYGEVFPIVKAKLDMDDDQTDAFIENNVDNLGHIDTKEDLQNEMSTTVANMFAPTGQKGDTNFSEPDENGRRFYQPPPFSQPPKNLTGRARTDSGRTRVLRDGADDYVREQGISIDKDLTPEQEKTLKDYDDEYFNITGKHLWESNTMRRDTGHILQRLHTNREGFKGMRERYGLGDDMSGAAFALLNNGVELNPDTILLEHDKMRTPYIHERKVRYEPTDGSIINAKAQRDKYLRSINEMNAELEEQKKNKVVDKNLESRLRETTRNYNYLNDVLNQYDQMMTHYDKSRERLRGRYTNAYNTFKKVRDQYSGDPEMQKRLDTIWRAYIGDIAKQISQDENQMLYNDLHDELRDLVVGKRKSSESDEEYKKRIEEHLDELNESNDTFDNIFNRYLGKVASGEDLVRLDPGKPNYLFDVLDNISDFGKAHIKRMEYDRTADRYKAFVDKYLGRIGLSLDKLIGLPKKEAMDKIRRHAYDTFVKNKEGHVGVMNLRRDLKNDLDKYLKDANNNVSYNQDYYGSDEDFRESIDKWKDIKNMTDLFKLTLNSNVFYTPKGFKGMGNYLNHGGVLPGDYNDDEYAKKMEYLDIDNGNLKKANTILDSWRVNEIEDRKGGAYDPETSSSKKALESFRTYVGLYESGNTNRYQVDQLSDDELNKIWGWITTILKRALTYNAYKQSYDEVKNDPTKQSLAQMYRQLGDGEKRAFKLFYSPDTVLEDKHRFIGPYMFRDEVSAFYRTIDNEVKRREEEQKSL